ncbi:MAG: M23 family metallopeptidase, partial [Hyphomonadaceae bacterium]
MIAIWRELVLGLGLFWFGGAPVALAEPDEMPELTAEELEIAASFVTACGGALTQGGLIICEGEPGAEVFVDGIVYELDATGHAYVGIPRNAPNTFTMQTIPENPGIGVFTMVATIDPRHDEESVISGIDCDKIDARTDEQKAHAGRSWVKKQDAWKIFNTGIGASEGFLRPAEGIVSSPFGFIRKYVTPGCDTKIKPHFGYDIAAPTGAPIIAPASGTVILAEDD